MNGLGDIKDICFLRIRGQNKLFKEIDEIQTIKKKLIDHTALHRNEVTGEFEDPRFRFG